MPTANTQMCRTCTCYGSSQNYKHTKFIKTIYYDTLQQDNKNSNWCNASMQNSYEIYEIFGKLYIVITFQQPPEPDQNMSICPLITGPYWIPQHSAKMYRNSMETVKFCGSAYNSAFHGKLWFLFSVVTIGHNTVPIHVYTFGCHTRNGKPKRNSWQTEDKQYDGLQFLEMLHRLQKEVEKTPDSKHKQTN